MIKKPPYHALSALTLASAAILAGCASTPKATPPKQTGAFDYPHARTHQDTKDHLYSGEYGRPDGFVGAGMTSDPLRPDDGIDHYMTETIVDKYRWLENIDPINPNYRYETNADRERNTTGSRLENDAPDGQFDGRTQEALASVNPNPKSSEVNDWVNKQNKLTANYVHNLPIYDQVRKNLQSFMFSRHRYQKFDTDIGEIEYIRDTDGHDRILYTDKTGTTKTIFDQKLSISQGDGYARRREIYPSDTGKYIAYYLAHGNGDNDAIYLHIVDTTTGQDVIKPIRHVGRWDYVMDVMWDDDTAFYYICEANGWEANLCRYDLTKKRFNQKIEVAGADSEYLWLESAWFDGEKDDDKRYIILEGYSWKPTFYIKDRKKNRVYRIHDEKFKNKVRREGHEKFQADILAEFVHFDPKTRDVWFWSTADSSRGGIYKTNLDNTNKRELVIPTPKQYHKISEAIYHDEGDGYFVVAYIQDAVAKVVVMDKQGNIVKDLTPQGRGVLGS